MGVPYEIKPQGGLVAPGGQSSCFELRHPSRAAINKIIVRQTSGLAVNFTVALFNHEAACQGESDSDSDTTPPSPATGPLPADLYRVTPDLNSNSVGALTYFSNQDTGGGGFGFVGLDDDRLGKSRKLYVKITPQGTGAKTFAIAIGGEGFEASS